jgi:hypothetical protein
MLFLPFIYNTMLMKYKPEFLAKPWGFVATFLMVLVVLHFLLLEISPWGADTLQTTTILNTTATVAATSRLPKPTFTEDVSTLKTFLTGLGAGSKEQPAEPVSEITKAEYRKAHAMYPEDSDEEYAAICMAVKDQSQDLTEFFIHHYYHLGIRRFYIMDDGSEPPLASFDYPGVPRKHITFHYYNRTTDHVPDMQDHIYQSCVNLWRDQHVWMAFLDADEMLEMTGDETLTELLKRLEKNRSVGALAVSWMTHTSNGILKRPASSRKAFTDCIWDGIPTHNGMYKSIVKMEFYQSHNRVHQARLGGDTITVGEDGLGVPTAARLPPTRNRISLHHYALKSREEYEEKINRSNAMDDAKGWEFWNSVEGMGGVTCPSMATYEP